MNVSLVAALILFAAATDPTVPPHARQVQQAEGRGVQIYRCEPSGWTLVGPDTKLYSNSDAASPVTGTNTVGPTWTWIDGSSIRGKQVKQLPSPEPGSLPWLLLSAQPASATKGILSPVTWVRRSNTRGGVGPTGACNSAEHPEPLRVHYTATYTFYTSP